MTGIRTSPSQQPAIQLPAFNFFSDRSEQSLKWNERYLLQAAGETKNQKFVFPFVCSFTSHHRLHFLYTVNKQMLHLPTLSLGHPKYVPSTNMSTGVHWLRDLTKDHWKIPPGLVSYTSLRPGDLKHPPSQPLTLTCFQKDLQSYWWQKSPSTCSSSWDRSKTLTNAVSKFPSHETCKMSLGSKESHVKSLRPEVGRQQSPRRVS